MTINDIKSLLSSEPVDIDINNITKEHKFRLKIKCDDIYLETFFVPSEVRKIYVCLTAVAQDIKNYPVFHRASWADRVKGAFLCIDDPTRELIHHEISTYFYGSNDKNCVNYITKVVNKFCELYKIETNDIYFISNSNGAFGAISCCDLLEGSNCIVFNANINMPLWQKGKSTNSITHDILFQSIFNVDFNDNKYYNRFFLDRIIYNKLSHFYLYYNIASQRDKEQLEWLCKKIDFKYRSGIQQLGNVFFHIDEINSKHPMPHHIFPNECILPIAEDIMKYGITKTGSDALKILSNYMKLFYTSQNELFDAKNNNETQVKQENIPENILKSNNGYKIIGKNNIIKILHNKSYYTIKSNEIIKGLDIKINGDNNTILIGEHCIFSDSKIIIGNNNVNIDIGSRNRYTNTTIRCCFGDKQSFTTGQSNIINGAKFYLDENSAFILGDRNLFSSEIRVWCSDGHSILDMSTNSILNKPNKPVIIKNHCWIGQGVRITKNAHIPDNTIVGTGSVISKEFFDENTVIAGNPASVIKRNVKWEGKNTYFLEKSVSN